MADIKRVSVDETAQLLEQGYTYVDVRSQSEFAEGHVPGALNVPLMHLGAAGMQPNPDFLAVMQSAFGQQEQLVLGCKSGGRSMRAAQMLVNAGYQRIFELRTGWEGSKDAFGRIEPGWGKSGLPVEMGEPEGQRYEDVKSRKRGA